ncbi:helix-turn-helix transcriptional regulator [Streptomyces sp. NPDC006283]|uniref:helix-turn-helix transcriptional regulator n=1 Tax=Streptomyces sp. NPDC006283 TaxID=3156741 RepID=UPI0033BBD69D
MGPAQAGHGVAERRLPVGQGAVQIEEDESGHGAETILRNLCADHRLCNTPSNGSRRSSFRVAFSSDHRDERADVTASSDAAVDVLLAQAASLPEPAVRARLRQAGSLTQAEVAEAIGVHRIQVVRWECGQAEPRNPKRRAYARLLDGLAQRYPHALTKEDTQ